MWFISRMRILETIKENSTERGILKCLYTQRILLPIIHYQLVQCDLKDNPCNNPLLFYLCIFYNTSAAIYYVKDSVGTSWKLQLPTLMSIVSITQFNLLKRIANRSKCNKTYLHDPSIVWKKHTL